MDTRGRQADDNASKYHWMKRSLVVAAIILLIALAGGLIFMRYQRDIDAAWQRLVEAGSEVTATACGPIEYARMGKGPAILVVHGAGGGFDQGKDVAQPLIDAGFQAIAVSRFGYLRTALPADPSPEAQADAHACLLDALRIERAAIIGASAVAPSSMQFALRHPQRISHLVLLVPAAYVPRAQDAPSLKTPPGGRFLINTALRSDFLFWLAPRLAHGMVLRAILATPPDVVKQASADEQARANRIIDHILPVSARAQGLINDGAVVSSLQRYPLERIRSPTLVIGVADDLYGTFDAARYTADNIPGARFIGYETGGHVWVGHQRDVVNEIVKFLRE